MTTKAQIKLQMTTSFMGNATLSNIYGFALNDAFETHFSLVSLENIWFEIVASAFFIHAQLFGQHVKEVDEKILNQKRGGLPWYRFMALQFQYGFDLVSDKDYFDNGTATTEAIENSKIIKYSAVSEAEDSSRVIIKVAGEIDGVLSPISLVQQDAFEAYIKEIRIAGVQCTIINYLPDRLLLNIQIKRDALLLDSNGMSILNGNYPVVDALKEFMKELPFDGELRLSALVDKLQQVSGVLDATVLSAQSSWIDPIVNDYGTPQPIFISKVPVSGYFEIVNFDNIAYVV